MNKIFDSPVRTGAFLSLCVLIVYFTTLAPSVGFIDSGELAAVASTLGVAHPTGYPLFTLIGWMFANVPVGSEEIVRLNAMAAIFCAAGVFLFFLIIRKTLELMVGEAKKKQVDGGMITSASIGGALLIAFSKTYWSQSTNVEVYSLHVLLVGGILYAFLRAAFPSGDADNANRWWVIFAFLVGLSFANHMTTVLLGPGLLLVFLMTQGVSARSFKKLALMSIPFLAGLSVYLYLSIRASQSPNLNWGDTSSWETFFWHLSGKQYRVWIFSSTEAAGRQFKYFTSILPLEMAYVGVVAGVVGLVKMFMVHRKLFAMTMTLFASCVSYSINYDIHDIDSYFLLAYLCVGLWAGVGLFFFGEWSIRWSVSRNVVIASLVMFGLMPALYHYKEVDESRNYLVEDYTMNMFKSFERNAIVLSFQWDYWVSASYYYQFVRGFRPDVAVIDKELLRRSWYLKEMKIRYPEIMDRSSIQVDQFSRELYKFEHSVPYDPSIIQARFVEMIRSFIANNLSNRPIYVTPEVEIEFTAGFQRVPVGLAFQLRPDTTFQPSDGVSYSYRPLKRAGRLEDMIVRFYASSMIQRGIYYYNRANDVTTARASFLKATEYDPGNGEASRWLRSLPHD